MLRSSYSSIEQSRYFSNDFFGSEWECSAVEMNFYAFLCNIESF